MTDILNITDEVKINWKGIDFTYCLNDFTLKEGAKVATYTYAGRNGAEQERVLAARTISVSGEFIYGVQDKKPNELIKELRISNDNKPGVFIHPDIGTFTCIISNLSITQSGDGYTLTDDNSLKAGYKFSIDFLEHTPPNAKTFKEENDLLFPKSDVKPPSDDYNTSLIYKNADELYEAIIIGKIDVGINPVVHAEWLKYPYDMRKEAFDRWKLDGYPINVTETGTPNSNTNQRTHIVKIGNTGLGIAKLYNVSFPSLFAINRGIEVRTANRGTEGLYRTTSRLIYPNDRIIIPNS